MDTDLVVRAQGGDQGAFASLATASYGRLHRVAQNILSDLQLAEDATQQAMLEMWRSLPRLRDPERFEAWSSLDPCPCLLRRGSPSETLAARSGSGGRARQGL